MGQPIDEFASVFQCNSFHVSQKELKADGWRLKSHEILRLLDKLCNAGKPLNEYVNGRFYRGITPGLNEAFVVDRVSRDKLIAEHPSSAEVLKPFLKGRDVKRWRVNSQDIWLIFTRQGIDIKKYPAIHEYLSQYEKQLTPGILGGRKPGSYKWYEIQDNIAYWREFEQPKIVFPDIAQEPCFTFDKTGAYLGNTAYIITLNDFYLLGVLNSLIVKSFYTQLSSQVRGGYLRFIRQYVEQIPIPTALNSECAAITNLVQKCINAKGDNVAQWEAEIDERVGHLYGLTTQEMKIIKGE